MMRAALSVLSAAATMSMALVLTGCPNESATTGGTGGSGGSTTTTGGTGGAATTTTTTTTTTAPLTCSADVSKPPLDGDCDLLQQNCPPGKTCVPGATKTFCQSGGGLKGAGKTCNLNNGNNECQAGLFCIGANDIGICTRPCCTDNNEPCGGGDCNGEVNFGNVIVTMCSYSTQCTLFEEGTCADGLKCQLVYANQGLAVCTLPAPMNVAEGQPCQFVNQCGANQVCWASICRYNCLLTGGAVDPGKGGCPDTQACADLLPEAAGDVGVCQPAP